MLSVYSGHRHNHRSEGKAPIIVHTRVDSRLFLCISGIPIYSLCPGWRAFLPYAGPLACRSIVSKRGDFLSTGWSMLRWEKTGSCLEAIGLFSCLSHPMIGGLRRSIHSPDISPREQSISCGQKTRVVFIACEGSAHCTRPGWKNAARLVSLSAFFQPEAFSLVKASATC